MINNECWANAVDFNVLSHELHNNNEQTNKQTNTVNNYNRKNVNSIILLEPIIPCPVDEQKFLDGNNLLHS